MSPNKNNFTMRPSHLKICVTLMSWFVGKVVAKTPFDQLIKWACSIAISGCTNEKRRPGFVGPTAILGFKASK